MFLRCTPVRFNNSTLARVTLTRPSPRQDIPLTLRPAELERTFLSLYPRTATPTGSTFLVAVLNITPSNFALEVVKLPTASQTDLPDPTTFDPKRADFVMVVVRSGSVVLLVWYLRTTALMRPSRLAAYRVPPLMTYDLKIPAVPEMVSFACVVPGHLKNV